MDLWGSVALLAALYFGYQWLLQQQAQAQRQHPQHSLLRVPEPTTIPRGPPTPSGKKGKGKKGKADAVAPKGMGSGLDGRGETSAAPEEAADQHEPASLEDANLNEVLASYLAKAEQHRTDMGDKRATIEHLVLAMAEDPRFGEVLGCTTGFQEEELKTAIKKSRVLYNRGQEYDEAFEMSTLSKYSRDLTEAARQGKLDPVIGRADEMRRLIDVLCRRTKNSAVLLGEAGVGKTAIVEGLAQRIAQDDVPEGLRGCRVIALEMGLLMAGAAFPGEFEERLRSVLKELQQEGLRAILFIDDIHTITGPNAQQGGGVMDASVMLKPLLSRGEVRCLGCTSLDKYRKFIEKDPGLERRFQTVPVDPPSVVETISILRGLRHKYESHHGVRITDAALAAAAHLGDRYLPDRFLPDKAIDLVDEAAAKVKTDLALRPEALDRIERRIGQLEKERKLLARSAVVDTAVAAELEELEAELARLKTEASEMTVALEADIKESDRTQSLQDEIDRLNAEIEAAEEDGNTAKADNLKRQKREELVRKLRLRARTNKRSGTAAWLGGGKLTRAEVSEPDVARVISKWTGIPLTKLVESEAGKLLALADELHKRIIGQHEAVVAVAEAIQRSRAGMKDPNGPIASFLFLGPTGVGKTELAKALAANLFNTDDAMTRLDMSEYMEKHAVAKLIGAPPGYVGYDEGGQLTEQVRRKPYSVVLFDEVEKAHVDVFNLLLQILDDGRVTDSQGRVVSFKNAIIILTSNLGSAEVFNYTYKQRAQGGAGSMAEMRELVMERVRKHFQPEFINRIDEFIIFEPLAAEQIETIVRLQVRGVGARLAEKKMKLALQDSAVKHLAAVGFDPVYGARPVKRAVQRELETPLAKALLTGQFQEDDTVVVEAAGEGAAAGGEGAGGEGAAGAAGSGWLEFARIPGATALEEGGGGNGDAAAAEGVNGGPIPVTIPGHTPRPSVVPKHAAAAAGGGGGAAAPAPAAAAAGGKFDPLKARKKPAAAATAPQQQQQPPAEGGGEQAAASSSNGSAGGAAAAAASAAGGEGGAAAGLDASVSESLLHGGQTPAFLKPPRRRDEQEEAPTCAG